MDCRNIISARKLRKITEYVKEIVFKSTIELITYLAKINANNYKLLMLENTNFVKRKK